jgi:hypothetical protein
MTDRNDLLSRCERAFRGQEVLISASDDERWLVHLMPSRLVGHECLLFEEPGLAAALERALEWLEAHQEE